MRKITVELTIDTSLTVMEQNMRVTEALSRAGFFDSRVTILANIEVPAQREMWCKQCKKVVEVKVHSHRPVCNSCLSYNVIEKQDLEIVNG